MQVQTAFYTFSANEQLREECQHKLPRLAKVVQAPVILLCADPHGLRCVQFCN